MLSQILLKLSEVESHGVRCTARFLAGSFWLAAELVYLRLRSEAWRLCAMAYTPAGALRPSGGGWLEGSLRLLVVVLRIVQGR